eukprot:386362-Rhodomonas_salina.3
MCGMCAGTRTRRFDGLYCLLSTCGADPTMSGALGRRCAPLGGYSQLQTLLTFNSQPPSKPQPQQMYVLRWQLDHPQCEPPCAR